MPGLLQSLWCRGCRSQRVNNGNVLPPPGISGLAQLFQGSHPTSWHPRWGPPISRYQGCPVIPGEASHFPAFEVGVLPLPGFRGGSPSSSLRPSDSRGWSPTILNLRCSSTYSDQGWVSPQSIRAVHCFRGYLWLPSAITFFGYL